MSQYYFKGSEINDIFQPHIWESVAFPRSRPVADIVNACLPEQGAIEFQHDQEGKEHSWHAHDTDETIVVIDGTLQFYWENGKETCQAGDVIELPKGTKHGSIAINGDAKYIITFEHIHLS